MPTASRDVAVAYAFFLLPFHLSRSQDTPSRKGFSSRSPPSPLSLCPTLPCRKPDLLVFGAAVHNKSTGAGVVVCGATMIRFGEIEKRKGRSGVGGGGPEGEGAQAGYLVFVSPRPVPVQRRDGVGGTFSCVLHKGAVGLSDGAQRTHKTGEELPGQCINICIYICCICINSIYIHTQV